MTAIRKQEHNRGVVVEVIQFTDHAVPVVDVAGTTAKATLQLDGIDVAQTLPEGRIFFFDANIDLVVTKSSAGVDDDAAGDVGLGTAQANDTATPLATTEQNLIPNTAITFESGAETIQAGSTATESAKVHDNTAGTSGIWLNFLIDDADHDVTSTACNLILNGTVSFAYLKIGDD